MNRWHSWDVNSYSRYVPCNGVSCASQPGKPHSEVDNDHGNSSKYQQNIVDEHTEVAAEGSFPKALGPLIVSSIIVIGSLEVVTTGKTLMNMEQQGFISEGRGKGGGMHWDALGFPLCQSSLPPRNLKIMIS